MFYLANIEKNIKLGFDFINKLPDDFEAAKSKSEKWVPFVMSLKTPESTIAITEKNKAPNIPIANWRDFILDTDLWPIKRKWNIFIISLMIKEW